MSNLGFSIENDYSAPFAARKARGVRGPARDLESMLAKRRPAAPAGFYLILGAALVSAVALAFPDAVSALLHHLPLMR